MKTENSKKEISNLENQSIDSEKIKGGGVGPYFTKLTKDEINSVEAQEGAMSNATDSLKTSAPVFRRKSARQK